jgi:hypothetical protein
MPGAILGFGLLLSFFTLSILAFQEITEGVREAGGRIGLRWPGRLRTQERFVRLQPPSQHVEGEVYD